MAAAGVAGIAARGRASRRTIGDLTLHRAGDHAGAGHFFFGGDANANRASGLVAHLLGHADRVLDLASGLDAGHAADLNVALFPDLTAHGNFADGGHFDAHLLANRVRAVLVLGAVNPFLLGARLGGAALGSARVTRIRAALVEEVREVGGNLAAFPVAQTHELLLRAGFRDGLPFLLADRAVFIDGNGLADLATLGLRDRDALDFDAVANAFLRNHHALDRIILLGATLDAIDGPFHFVRLGDALRDLNGPHRGGGTTA